MISPGFAWYGDCGFFAGSIMKKKLFLFVATLTTLFGLQIRGFSQDSRLFAAAERVTGDQFAVSVSTPNGVIVYAVRRPSAAMLHAVDKGLTDLFSVAQKNGYRRGLNYSSYTVFIANADRLKDGSGRYSPDIAVGAAQYAGTEYDKGGYIFAGGMVIARNPMAFVIAEHTSDFGRVSDLVRYEGEHLVLYQNDRRRYEATKDHSKGGGHPILR
jgi:hypothetical protein